MHLRIAKSQYPQYDFADCEALVPNEIEEITEVLGRASHIAVLTGAGTSAESGIPTFRDALTGLWAKYDPAELATPEAFARDPMRVTQWYDERRLKAAACSPNAGHS